MTADILYITRKFPPSVGGMEQLARSVAEALAQGNEIDLIALGRRQSNLAWFLPAAALRSIGRKYRLVVFGDVLVATALRHLVRAERTAVVVHGLDLTFSIPGYQIAARRALQTIDHLVAISLNTKRLLEERGIRGASVVVPGVPTEGVREEASARSLIGLSGDVPLLVFLGRLVQRKGIERFVRDVFPLVDRSVHLAIIGDGPDRAAIESAISQADTARVHMSGVVADDRREAFLCDADLVVMPNVEIPDDPEGFGLVAAEATLRGTPVVATKVDAVVEALMDGKCGFLIDPGQPQLMASTINELFRDRDELAAAGERFRIVASEVFSEEAFRNRFRAAVGL